MSKISLILDTIPVRKHSEWSKFIHEFIWLLEGEIGSKILNRSLNKKHAGKYLNLGCGTLKYNGWVNADYYRIYEIIRNREEFPDWMLDATQLWNCPDDFFGGIFCEHAIEHIAYRGVIKLLQESYRTLQSGCYMRIIVPDLSKYIRFYTDEIDKENFNFPDKAIAISNLTQQWGHISTWDKNLLTEILSEIGFVNISEVSFKIGSDNKLLKDTLGRQWESLYIEAQKPN